MLQVYAHKAFKRTIQIIRPGTPTLLESPGPGELIWKGSAWARGYEIWRSRNKTRWDRVAANVTDNVEPETVIWKDSNYTAPSIPGQRRSYYYRIRAFGSATLGSPFSNIIVG